VSAVGLIGIILCLAALPFYPPARTQRGLLLFACLLVLHIAASVAFYEYALTSSADASLYYFDATGLRRSEMGFGTIFTIKLVQAVKAVIGGTYLDFFLIFQTFGFWGLLFFQRCIEHAQRHFGDAITPPPYWLLFLPGLHFWTGAIGKDAPLFLCVGLATWASIRLSSRAIWFAVAVAIMLFFRPHIALLAAGAHAGAALFGSKSSLIVKAFLVAVCIGALAIVAGTVEKSLIVDLSDPASVGAFLEQQQQRAGWIPGATNLQNSFFLVRLFSLLFRPLFIDAGGIFGLVSSFENLAYIVVIGFMTWNWREGVQLFRAALEYRFAFFFALTLTVLLALTYYNVGLGLRQKTMMMPALLSFFAAQWMLHRARINYWTYAAGADRSVAETDHPVDSPVSAR
jgi:hypothetical protein